VLLRAATFPARSYEQPVDHSGSLNPRLTG
jgi:hypothetical protein